MTGLSFSSGVSKLPQEGKRSNIEYLSEVCEEEIKIDERGQEVSRGLFMGSCGVEISHQTVLECV